MTAHRLPRRRIQQRNDALLYRHADEQAFELFQSATCWLTEGDKAAAAKDLRKALEVLRPYRNPVAADIADLLAKIDPLNHGEQQ